MKQARALALHTVLPAALLLALTWVVPPLRAESDPERMRAAKELVFDKKYAEARTVWQTIVGAAKGAEADTASFWVARCSEGLGENERALKEYGAFLDRRPADRALAEEARTSRVGLATRLYRAGRKEHLSVVTTALAEDNKTVRYYAALQLASLGAPVGLPAVPVLKQIIAREKDEDLVERAKLGILKLDPSALTTLAPPAPAAAPKAAPAPGAAPAPHPAGWIRVRVYEKGRSEPEVSINLPLALAEMVFKSLPDEARRELRLKGYDADNFWERLRKLGPAEIIDIRGDDGEKIQIWIE
jgi:hypothetical protein